MLHEGAPNGNTMWVAQLVSLARMFYLCDIPPSGPHLWHPPLSTHYTYISFLGQAFKTVCGLPH